MTAVGKSIGAHTRMGAEMRSHVRPRRIDARERRPSSIRSAAPPQAGAAAAGARAQHRGSDLQRAREHSRVWSTRCGPRFPTIAWELIVVDDNSPDGTAEIAKQIAATDSRIRCIRRVGRRGLAGACLEGILSSQARYVAVMDGDLQHDERLLHAHADAVAPR